MKKYLNLTLILVATLLFIGAGCNDDSGKKELGTPSDIESNEPLTTDNSPTDRGQSEAEETTKLEPKTVIVKYTAFGFMPDPMIINMGDTVQFINDTEDPLQIASDPHPIHTDTPGLDSRTPLEKGESYQFTFNKRGETNYHNHLQPTEGGSIIIR